MKTASALQVAKYIVKKQKSVTTMKLQKLVYYCQAWSMVWEEIPLFKEKIQAWANGPVCPELFKFHKGRYVLTPSDFSDVEDFDFTDKQKATMDKVLKFYGDKEPNWLSELTHKEAPWKNARVNIKMGEHSEKEITLESMQEYYGGLHNV